MMPKDYKDFVENTPRDEKIREEKAPAPAAAAAPAPIDVNIKGNHPKWIKR